MSAPASIVMATEQQQQRQEQQQQQQQRKRAHKACLNCRRRKAKCELDTTESTSQAVCKRCKEEGSVCEIPTIERRGGFTNVLAGKERRRLQELLKSRSSQNLSTLNSDWTTMNSGGKMPSSWAQSIPKQKTKRSASMSMPDEEDETRTVYLESQQGSDLSGDFGIMASSAPASFSGNSSVLTSANFERRPRMETPQPQPQPEIVQQGSQRSPEETHAYLRNAQIVKDGIIDAEDVPELVSFFFSHMDPFFYPFIPRAYHDIHRLVNEPAMLVVICTIAAKSRLQETYSEQHRRLWAYCKQVVSSLMWECPENEVQSLIYAVLLLCEWLPGAMYLEAEKHASGIDAIKRYTRICWPLLGQAVRLAHYVGLLENDIQAFITLHLSDHLLACRLGCQPMVGQLFEGDTPMPLAASIADRARLDIVKIMHLSNRMLYGSTVKSTREIISSGQYLSLFHMLLAQLDQWRTDYSQYTKCATFGDRVMMCEFHHIPLHTFSLAIIPWQERQHQERVGKGTPQRSSDYENLIGLEESRKFVDLAIESARFMIEHIEEPSNPINLRYAPIQWIMRLLYSGVFLAKTLLIGALHPTKERQKNTIRTIRKAVEVMRSSQPNRYDPYCDLLDAICDQVISGGSATSHIMALEKLQQEYRASKGSRAPKGRPPGPFMNSELSSSNTPSQKDHFESVSPISAMTTPVVSESNDSRQNSETIPIMHETPSSQPYKSRRLDGFSPPLSPGKPQWVLEPSNPIEAEPELESESEQELREPEIPSLECTFNTMEDMESIWDFLGDTNFTDLSISPSSVATTSLAL